MIFILISSPWSATSRRKNNQTASLGHQRSSPSQHLADSSGHSLLCYNHQQIGEILAVRESQQQWQQPLHASSMSGWTLCTQRYRSPCVNGGELGLLWLGKNDLLCSQQRWFQSAALITTWRGRWIDRSSCWRTSNGPESRVWSPGITNSEQFGGRISNKKHAMMCWISDTAHYYGCYTKVMLCPTLS